jgi:chromosomal replication initiator protein
VELPNTHWEAVEPVRDADVLWDACADILRAQVSEAVWLTSFNGAQPLALNHGVLTLAVPSSVVKERIEGRYLALVRDALTEAGADEVALSIEVHTELDDASQIAALGGIDGDRLAAETLSANGMTDEVHPTFDEPVARITPWPGDGPSVDAAEPRYSFESFVIGASNRFAHAAALSVAERPAGPTTRCSSTATPGSARPTSSRRSPTTSATTPARSSATSPPRRS